MVINSDNIAALKSMDSNSIDSCVTDPPYGLKFMGKKWDYDVPAVELWLEVLRVLKPGGHILAFGGTRTYHRMVVNIEDAGFQIRDQIQWLYGSGFPKSHNLGDGWGTALKPASEPIVMARKPLSEKTVAANVLKWGTGGINVDVCRIGTKEVLTSGRHIQKKREYPSGYKDVNRKEFRQNPQGRFPANVLLDEYAAGALDQQSGAMKGVYNNTIMKGKPGTRDGSPVLLEQEASKGGASRFFYVAKASRRERGEGNNHPTVKPIRLMEYLCRLITPPEGVILDPFLGSGSTYVAALNLGFKCVGIERNSEYSEIATGRINCQP